MDSIADGLPAEFGFPVVAHPRVDGTVWLFPFESCRSASPRTTPAGCGAPSTAGRPGRRGDGTGLPDRFFTGVMRDAMCVDDGDPAGVYFGSRDGSVFGSPDEGDDVGADRRPPPRRALRQGSDAIPTGLPTRRPLGHRGVAIRVARERPRTWIASISSQKDASSDVAASTSAQLATTRAGTCFACPVSREASLTGSPMTVYS